MRIARIFNTYGPRMCLDDGRVVSNFVAQVKKLDLLFSYFLSHFLSCLTTGVWDTQPSLSLISFTDYSNYVL